AHAGAGLLRRSVGASARTAAQQNLQLLLAFAQHIIQFWWHLRAIIARTTIAATVAIGTVAIIIITTTAAAAPWAT
ncbi:MAG: hypothetical protein VW417_07755, partial [Alphaproteobacteria bacterium]